MSATALLGLGAAVAAFTATTEPAAAATVFGTRATMRPLGLTGAVVGRHRNLFRSFNLTSSTGLGRIVAWVSVGATSVVRMSFRSSQQHPVLDVAQRVDVAAHRRCSR